MEKSANKVTKPSNCLLTISLPLTKEDFFSDLEEDSNKDYAKSRQSKIRFNKDALWEIDHLPMVTMIEKTAQEVEQLNVKVIKNFKLSDFNQLSNFKVITVITHSIGEGKKIELFDGLFDISEFVDNIPLSFNGIFDLTICNSIVLQEEIKAKRPNCIVLANKNQASLDFRLVFYKNLIKYIHQKELNYIDAFADLRIELFKQIK